MPVYDGRATKDRPAFVFSDNDFRCLLTWPLYKNGGVEIPVNAVISVGCTVSTYRGKSGLNLNLSTNVQFVIVLAVPECI